MNRKLLAGMAPLAALLILSGLPILAHHGVDPSYDATHPTTLQANVTAFEFINPHAKLYFEVKGENGNVEKWSAEMGSPNSLRRNGWTKDTIKPGDEIKITGAAAKDGSKKMVLQKLVFSDGRPAPQAGGLLD